MEVEVQGRAEALNEGDGAALATRRVPLALCAPAKRREECTEKGAEDLTGEGSVVGAAVAERVRKRPRGGLPLEGATREWSRHSVQR